MHKARAISIGVAVIALVVVVGLVHSAGHGSTTTKVKTTNTNSATTLAPPPTFKTTTGGVALNTSGQLSPVTYTSTGGGPGGAAVPTVVNGVAMPRPGTPPTKAQIAAARSIPYTPGPSDTSGINWAAIDALAGVGYVQ